MRSFDDLMIPVVLNINKCITIDQAATPPDNGALACDRIAYPQHFDNNDNPHAMNNLAHSAPTQTVGKIVGHGDRGVIATGGGQSPSYSDDVIWLYTSRPLADVLAPIVGRFRTIELEGCHVGAGVEGALLLWTIARITKSVVMGPTGLVSCGGGVISLEPGSTWQVANPTMSAPPPAIDPPKNPPAAKMPGSESMKFVQNAVEIELPLSTISSVRVEFVGRRSGVAQLTVSQSKDLAALLGLENPLRWQGRPLALVSAFLTIEAHGQSAEPLVKHFRVLNDRLLEDVAEKNVFYSCDPALASTLGQLAEAIARRTPRDR